MSRNYRTVGETLFYFSYWSPLSVVVAKYCGCKDEHEKERPRYVALKRQISIDRLKKIDFSLNELAYAMCFVSQTVEPAWKCVGGKNVFVVA